MESNGATVLKSQTSRNSYAYDASISSIDEAPIYHNLNKYHLMSMRTFRLQRPLKLASNTSKEGEADNYALAEHQLSKISLKSRTNSNEITDESNPCTNKKLQSVRSNLPTYKKHTSEMNQESHSKKPTFISSALRSQKQDRIELLNNTNDIRKHHTGHHHCSSYPSHGFSWNSSKYSSCAHNPHHSSLIEEVEKLKMKDKRLQARRRCRPISNGAPFVTCGQCFELIRLPIDLFVSKRRSSKLQCGACSKILLLQFPAKGCSTSKKFADANSCPQAKSVNSLQVRNCEQELLPPLHQLMGYFSASEVLYQVTDVDEGYESSEPAMPDSYRRYEEERHKNLLVHCSEAEAYFGSVETKGNDSSKILNKRERLHLNSLVNGIKRMETWGSKIGG